ncbi:hypothetical protein IGI04_019281 [Brassica rapa subsp. trilocularis]|uniref:Uncharacterized protein n=1 Tax=Brassica rapa subsp. trilocularis TaxID=1813537 RepID=A0ABQ7MFS0_BRACM|nr:hypothetical protein IGI04_019281 [Brassica rapa subsp. trilocularis]
MTLEAAHPPRAPAFQFDDLTQDEYGYAEEIGSVYLNLPRYSVRQNRRRPDPQHLVTIDMLEDMIA